MLQVRDVVASSTWHQAVIGLTSGHGGDEFWDLVAHHNEATLVDPDGYTVILHSPVEPGA
jgi:hypothetical protein